MSKPTKTTIHSKRGGVRPGAGAPLKSPESGPRVAITIKVAPATRSTLKRYVTPGRSQSEIVDQAVATWAQIQP